GLPFFVERCGFIDFLQSLGVKPVWLHASRILLPKLCQSFFAWEKLDRSTVDLMATPVDLCSPFGGDSEVFFIVQAFQEDLGEVSTSGWRKRQGSFGNLFNLDVHDRALLRHDQYTG